MVISPRYSKVTISSQLQFIVAISEEPVKIYPRYTNLIRQSHQDISTCQAAACGRIKSTSSSCYNAFWLLVCLKFLNPKISPERVNVFYCLALMVGKHAELGFHVYVDR